MKSYIGSKLVKAEPQEKDGKEGYRVVYEDGYESWSPNDVFEKAYLEVTSNPNRPSKVSIDQQMVKDFIASVDSMKSGDKTTIVRVTLKNGFEIVETSACVDKANYDQELGTKICMKRIEDKVWELLGFLLQTAYMGVNKGEMNMDRKFKIGDVVRLKSDINKNCLMTVSQVGANFCFCLVANGFGVSSVIDAKDELIPFPFETLMFA